jgi:uncharacterized protein (TIGR02145 family)
MRTLIFSILMMAVAVASLQSQDLNIHKTDGSIITIPLNTIDSITFVESGGPFVCGTSTVTDADGNIYNTVQIGDQCWMKENLKVGTMVNGSVEQTNNGIIEKYCYNNDFSNCDVYGGLYQWDEMMGYTTTSGVQGICPDGWHLPTDAGWTSLTTFLSGESVAGGKMKEAGTAHWYPPNTGATNSSGFTALPGGYRYTGGSCGDVGYTGLWWSSSEGDASSAWYRGLSYGNAQVSRYGNSKSYGFSVRCLKD